MKHPLPLAQRLFGRRFLLPAIVLGTLGAASSYGVTITWDANGTGSGTGRTGMWDNSTTPNWTTDSTGASATSTYTALGGSTTASATDTTIALFGGNAGTVTVASGNTINVNQISIALPGYVIASADSTAMINLDGVTPGVTQTNGYALTISANLTGTAGFTKTGSGSLTLTGNNSYSGGYSSAGGTTGNYTLTLGNNSVLGTGTATFANTNNNTTLQTSGTSAITFTNNVSFSNAIVFGGGTGNTGNLTFGAFSGGGTVTVNNTTTFSSLTFTGALALGGNGALVILGNFTQNQSRDQLNGGILAVGGTTNNGGKTFELGTGTTTAPNQFGTNGSITTAFGGNNFIQFNNGAYEGFFAFGTGTSFGAAANNFTVNAGGSNATLIYQGGSGTGTGGVVAGTANFAYSGQTVVLGNALSNGTVTLTNGVNFNVGTQTIQVDHGATNTAAAPDAILSGVLSNGGLNKTGTGILSLTGANNYAGGTTISAGTLLANYNVVSGTASSTGTGTVTVSNAGTILGGNGRIIGATTINAGAILQGGSAAATTGTLTLTNSLTLANTSVIQLYLNSGLTHSSIALAGATTAFATNQSFTFLLNGATPGTYQDIITGLTADPGVAGWSYTNVNGFSATFSFDGANVDLNVISTVPEPSTVAAGILTLAILGYRQRRQIKSCLTACRRIGVRG